MGSIETPLAQMALIIFDILCLVFNILYRQKDFKTLKHCSLVDSLWRDCCLPLLFHNVRHNANISSALTFFDTPTSIGVHVRNLSLSSPPRPRDQRHPIFGLSYAERITTADLVKLIAHMPQLVELWITGWCWEADEEPVTVPAMRGLKRIFLLQNRCTDGGKGMARMLNLSDAWDVVHIVRNICETTVDEEDTGRIIAISNLLLTLPYHEDDGIDPLAYHLPPRIDLQSFTLECRNFSVVDRLLRTKPIFSTIKQLHLRIENPISGVYLLK
ncbi:hypothetical protein EIP86_000598 [Pleurotus ostreatoroseus]|nr:hypothetical protein EIP86_000598 [Pleurotus ostreatoroseus]